MEGGAGDTGQQEERKTTGETESMDGREAEELPKATGARPVSQRLHFGRMRRLGQNPSRKASLSLSQMFPSTCRLQIFTRRSAPLGLCCGRILC